MTLTELLRDLSLEISITALADELGVAADTIAILAGQMAEIDGIDAVFEGRAPGQIKGRSGTYQNQMLTAGAANWLRANRLGDDGD